MIVNRPNFDYYIKLLDEKPFAFVRYGDGEFISILGTTKGRNCDRHEYFAEMGIDLRMSLEQNHPDYIRAIGHMALEHDETGIENYLSQNNLEIEWHYTDVFLRASIDGKLNPLVKKLRCSKLLYAAPAHLKPFLQKELGAEVIEIPPLNAYLYIDTIYSKILSKINDCDIFCMSGGMVTKIILYRLWFEQGIQNKTLLDIGSMWDGYVGKNSRSHTRQLRKPLMAQNLKR